MIGLIAFYQHKSAVRTGKQMRVCMQQTQFYMHSIAKNDFYSSRATFLEV